jgi:hypothetical protein
MTDIKECGIMSSAYHQFLVGVAFQPRKEVTLK